MYCWIQNTSSDRKKWRMSIRVFLVKHDQKAFIIAKSFWQEKWKMVLIEGFNFYNEMKLSSLSFLVFQPKSNLLVVFLLFSTRGKWVGLQSQRRTSRETKNSSRLWATSAEVYCGYYFTPWGVVALHCITLCTVTPAAQIYLMINSLIYLLFPRNI